MVYLHDDMAGFAVNAAIDRPRPARAGPTPARPRSYWRGSSAMPSAARSRRCAFAWRELFNPLGMRNVTLRVRRLRHAAGIDLHAGERARLGAVRSAVSQ